MHYKIKINKDNQAIIKRIANENGMNPNNFEFIYTGFWFIINGIFPMGNINNSYPELTTNQFIEMFDNKTIKIEKIPKIGTKEFNDLASQIFGGKSKQDAIREAAKNNCEYNPDHLRKYDNDFIGTFIDGAKSDAAKDYWFEQFKKK